MYYLHKICTETVSVLCPSVLLAVHVYNPASSFLTSCTTRAVPEPILLPGPCRTKIKSKKKYYSILFLNLYLYCTQYIQGIHVQYILTCLDSRYRVYMYTVQYILACLDQSTGTEYPIHVLCKVYIILLDQFTVDAGYPCTL